MSQPVPSAEPAARSKASRLRPLLISGCLLIAVAFAYNRYDQTRPAQPHPVPQNAPAVVGNAPSPATSPAASSPLTASPGLMTPPANRPTNLSAAVAQAQAQVRRKPEDIQARIRLAALLDSQGNASDAEDVLREALQHGRRDPEIYHALGMLYQHNNQNIGAISAFSLEVERRPKDPQAHLQLAAAFSYVGRADDAKREYETVQKLAPSLPEPYLGLAFLNNTQERFPYAVKYLNEYIKRSSQPGPGYALLCRVYLNMRLYDKAIEAGRKATVAMPTNASVWYNLGQACFYRPDQKYLQEAAEAFQHAVQIAPTMGDAHFELGSVYARLKRNTEAIAQFREAVRYVPWQGKFRYQLGRLLIQEGQAAEGKQEVEKSQALIALNQRETQLLDKLQVVPNDANNRLALAQIYRQEGRYAQALLWYQSTLEIAPDNPQARAELEEVRRLTATSGPSHLP